MGEGKKGSRRDKDTKRKKEDARGTERKKEGGRRHTEKD